MMKTISRILFFILCAWPLCSVAQSLTLGECLVLARKNYPLIRQYRLVEQSRGFTLANASKAWLPQVGVSAGAYAFTDIINGEGMPGNVGLDMKNHVAVGSVSVSQNIYDGGQTAARRRVVKAQAEVESRQLDVSLYEVDGRVEELFFGILLLDEQIKQNWLLQEDLGISRKAAESRLKNGMANSVDINLIEVEMLKARQQNEAFDGSRSAFLRMLAVFIGRSVEDDVTLERPSAVKPLAWGQSLVARPELDYYSAQNSLIAQRRRQLDAALMPRVSAFAMGMAHTRVTDMVKDNMLFGGITLSWNIGSLYTRKNDLRNIDLKKQEIDVMRDTFLFNNRLQHEQSRGSLDALERQVKLDGDIVSLRERIRGQSETKVKMGTESTYELLRNINAASQAHLQKAMHELQMLREAYRMEHIINR